MMINNDNLDILFRRLDELYDQMSRIRVCLKAIKEGKDFDIDFDEEIYTEMAQEKCAVLSHTARAIEHLLKLKYCTNNKNYNVWRNSVEIHLAAIEDTTDLLLTRDDGNEFIKAYYDGFDTAYKNGIRYYDSAMKNHDDLKKNRKFIPEKCPWKPDELLTKPIWWLLDKLPDPDELTTQMQLYQFCKYYGDYDDIKNKQCAYCDMYSDCISNYYDKNTRE